MELKQCRFYCCGDEMNFSVYSDAVCRARYLESIPVPFGEARVDVYEIQPGADSHWIVVRQKTAKEQEESKWFVREGERFVERRRRKVPVALKVEILHRFPSLAQPPASRVA
jgi:hypothetical protein